MIFLLRYWETILIERKLIMDDAERQLAWAFVIACYKKDGQEAISRITSVMHNAKAVHPAVRSGVDDALLCVLKHAMGFAETLPEAPSQRYFPA